MLNNPQQQLSQQHQTLQQSQALDQNITQVISFVFFNKSYSYLNKIFDNNRYILFCRWEFYKNNLYKIFHKKGELLNLLLMKLI